MGTHCVASFDLKLAMCARCPKFRDLPTSAFPVLGLKGSPHHTHTLLVSFLFYVYSYFICLYILQNMSMPGALRGQKRLMDPLGLELQIVGAAMQVVRNQT